MKQLTQLAAAIALTACVGSWSAGYTWEIDWTMEFTEVK